MARKKKSSRDTETEVDQESAGNLVEKTAFDLTGSEVETETEINVEKGTETELPDKSSETLDEELPDIAEKSDSETTSEESIEPEETVEAEKEIDNDSQPSDEEQQYSDAQSIDETQPADDATIRTETVEQVNILENPSVAQSKPVVIRQGGFVPMVLGGILAAAIGFGFARILTPDTGADNAVLADIESKLASQASTVSELGERIDAAGTGDDLSGIEAVQSDNQAAISELADQLQALESRLTDIENRPADEGEGPNIAVYEQELNELKAAVSAMSASAQQMEESAQEAAKATLQRAALTRIQTALDAGVGFEAALADLENLGVDVPAALQRAASDGVPSLSALQSGFPDAARSALAATRDVSDGSGEGGLTSFLRTQLGARSLQPREGNDSDAILSRAEAAAQQGRLNDALAEIELLPQEGRAQLSDWSDQATRRLEAVAAAQKLGENLN